MEQPQFWPANEFNTSKKESAGILSFTTALDEQTALGKRMVELLKKGRVGLILNLDGTLCSREIIPSQVSVSPGCRQALSHLQESDQFVLIAVISGRTAYQTREIVGIDNLVYLGNYGMEMVETGQDRAYPIKAARPYGLLIKSVLEAIKQELLNEHNAYFEQPDDPYWQQKLIFENKGITAAIHYTQCQNSEHVQSLILGLSEQITAKVGLLVRENQGVIEIYPPIDINKGTTLRGLIETHKLTSIIYVGNDQSDVDAFYTLEQLEQENRLLRQKIWKEVELFEGVAIAAGGPDIAEEITNQSDYVLDGVAGVERFLSFLVQLLTPVK